jgi:anti-sigma B factor antagonist
MPGVHREPVGGLRRVPGSARQPDGPAGFAAVWRSDGPDVVIALRGELDLAGAPTLCPLVDAVASPLGARVVLDLAQLAFVDASGIGAIERARDRLRGRGAQVIVRHPQPRVRRVLELCGLDGWLEGSEKVGRERAGEPRAGTPALPSLAR